VTSPGPDDVSRRLAAAATATGADRPQLAFSLAQSDLSTSEMQSVGGFVKALNLSNAQKLAANSGAKANFTADEKNSLAGIGVTVTDEDVVDDSRSWLEKATDWIGGAFSNTGNALVHNPVTEGLLTGMEWLGNAAHMPFRLVSDAIDTQNNDEIDAEMKAQGYDPESTTSYLSFMFGHGESQYHDLSGVRDTYGDDTVDLALQMQADPEQFQRDFEKMDPAGRGGPAGQAADPGVPRRVRRRQPQAHQPRPRPGPDPAPWATRTTRRSPLSRARSTPPTTGSPTRR
jgi:hypothetical protein